MSDALMRAIQRGRMNQAATRDDRVANLESLVNKLKARLDYLEDELGKIRDGDERLMRIALMVAERYGTNLFELKSLRRSSNISLARQVISYLAKENTPLSFVKIGRFLKRDHTTCMYGFQKIKALIETDQRLREFIQECNKKLNRENPELARDVGIEPTSSGLEAEALPLS